MMAAAGMTCIALGGCNQYVVNALEGLLAPEAIGNRAFLLEGPFEWLVKLVINAA